MEVHGVQSPRLALNALDSSSFDAVVSDVRMPGGDGVALLAAMRRNGAALPFVLMSGEPSVESALTAIELGAFRYLRKPFDIDQFVQVVEAAARRGQSLHDRPLHEQLTKALECLKMAYQPIVRVGARQHIASEALMRCDVPGCNNPGLLLELAERLSRLHELGHTVRTLAARDLSRLPPNVDAFVNLHPSDLEDSALFDPEAPLSRVAKRVVLEITERSSLEHTKDLTERVQRLRALGFRIAVDDLGAGYAGLTLVARLQPDVVKLDASLVRDIDSSPTKQHIVTSMVDLAKQLQSMVIAEAIETPAERDTLISLGIDLMQGYLFGRPALEPTAPSFGP